MPSNVEIKAKVHDFEQFKTLARSVSGHQGELILQEDVFFNVPHGRLKLRILQNCPAQLIFYTRADQNGPKLSNYTITEIHKPNDLKETLAQALGIQGVVKKQRLLFLVGQTRIHLDKVENLGCFMELEVVLKIDQTEHDGAKIVDGLKKQLNIDQSDLITCAYIDLISAQLK